MTIKTVLCSPCLVSFRLLTSSLQEHDPTTKLHELFFSKYCLNNTNIKKSLFRWEAKKRATLENQVGLVLTLELNNKYLMPALSDFFLFFLGCVFGQRLFYQDTFFGETSFYFNVTEQRNEMLCLSK